MSEALQSNAAISACADVLCEIRDPACNIAIWKREAPAGIEKLLIDNLKDVRFIASASQLRESLRQNLAAAQYADTVERDELIADIIVLADRYCAIFGNSDLEVRLEVVTTNSCRKWHADYVKTRLIMTYTGSGTQWLGPKDVERINRGEEPVSINSMSPGDVGIFKGRLLADTPAIHRSPPIEGTGEKRLLLVLNPAEQS